MLIIQNATLAAQLAALAKREGRPVEDVLMAMLAQYQPRIPVANNDDADDEPFDPNKDYAPGTTYYIIKHYDEIMAAGDDPDTTARP